MTDHRTLTVDALAQEIRRIDGQHDMGAGALAEALMPFIETHDFRSDAANAAPNTVSNAPAHLLSAATEERLVQQAKDYALGHFKDVARGAETPRLSALLIQKYGRGMADAVATICDNPRAADTIGKVVDEETANLDPIWREHDRERWAGRPADIISYP